MPEWIHNINSISAEKRQLMDTNQGTLLPIDDRLVFDLEAWVASSLRSENVAPKLAKKERAILFEDIAIRGVRTQPELDAESWNVLDGHNRLEGLLDARRNNHDVPFAGFHLLTFASPEENHLHRLNLTIRTRVKGKVRRALIAKSVALYRGWCDRRLAGALGCDPHTIANSRRKLVAAGVIEHVAVRETIDGKIENVDERARLRQERKAMRKQQPMADQEHKRLLRHWWDRHSVMAITIEQLSAMVDELEIKLPTEFWVPRGDEKGRSDLLGRWLTVLITQEAGIKEGKLIELQVPPWKSVYQIVPRRYLKAVQSVVSETEEDPVTIDRNEAPDAP